MNFKFEHQSNLALALFRVFTRSCTSYNKADINPVATCSTSSGFKCNAEAKRKLQPSEDDDVQCEKKKQKSKITPQDKRHKENLERKDRFLELFEHLIQKLWSIESIKLTSQVFKGFLRFDNLNFLSHPLKYRYYNTNLVIYLFIYSS